MKTHELLDRAADTIEKMVNEVQQPLDEEEFAAFVTELRAEAEAFRREWDRSEKAVNEAKTMETRPRP